MAKDSKEKTNTEKLNTNVLPETTAEIVTGEVEDTPEGDVDPVAKNEAYLNEMVEIKLFLDNDKYKDDVIVNVNGKAWQIQRGVTVSVPRFIKEVLEQSMEQDNNTAIMLRDMSAKFSREAETII